MSSQHTMSSEGSAQAEWQARAKAVLPAGVR